MSLRRIARHLFTTVWSARRAFPRAALKAIERTIQECERTHHGQIRFVVEHSLDLVHLLRGSTARDRAIELFAQLHVWDTEHNNGVLIYLLLADRNVEILADRGVHARVGPEGWEPIGREMERAFRDGDFERGVVRGIRAVSEHLDRHYPSGRAQPDELPDRPVVL
jgi:uncharacterized membrane protein